MLTCVAVVLNVGPFANTPNIDGFASAVRSAVTPSFLEQPNGSSFIAQREVDSHSAPHQQSAVEPANTTEPVEATAQTWSLSSVEAAARPVSRPVGTAVEARDVRGADKAGADAGSADAGAATEVRLQGLDPAPVDPAAQPYPNQVNPDTVKKDMIVGVWAPDASTCAARDFRDGVLPTVIDAEGAWAGDTFCAFTKKERTEEGWRVVAKCSNPRERWTSSVRLTVSDNRLTWTSKRGAQVYTRCEPDVLMAHAD
jgi:hypothetical protein